MLDNYTITIRERDDLAAKTTVIPPGVSEAAFNPAQASFLKPHVRAEWGIPEDTDFVISTGGRANEGKNYEAVLYGFADYMSMLPKHEQANTYLAVAIGSSNNRQQITYVESLKQLVNELPRVVQQNIRFVGFQANPVALYAGADAYVSLSRSETFGNTVAEAMSCGRPVVVSDIPSYGDQTDYSAANLSELSIPLGEAETMGHHTAAALATVRAHKDELSMWSLERAKHFTMRQSAMKLADVVLNLTD